jgi:hypothetical protein
MTTHQQVQSMNLKVETKRRCNEQGQETNDGNSHSVQCPVCIDRRYALLLPQKEKIGKQTNKQTKRTRK